MGPTMHGALRRWLGFRRGASGGVFAPCQGSFFVALVANKSVRGVAM